MIHSETLGELTKALVLAQSNFPVVPKSKTGKIKGQSARGDYEYSYKYADFPDVKAAIDPIIHQHGLAVTQAPEGAGLTTTLLHESGEWIESTMDLFLAKLDPQGQGSGITYAKRYAYCAALGVVADEDDDGAAAMPARSGPNISVDAVSKRFGAREESQFERDFHASKENEARPTSDVAVDPAPARQGGSRPATEKQWKFLASLVDQTVSECVKQYGEPSSLEMSRLIDGLKA